MTAIFTWLGESVDPMIELLKTVENGPNIFIIGSGLIILTVCVNMLITSKREDTEMKG